MCGKASLPSFSNHIYHGADVPQAVIIPPKPLSFAKPNLMHLSRLKVTLGTADAVEVQGAERILTSIGKAAFAEGVDTIRCAAEATQHMCSLLVANASGTGESSDQPGGKAARPAAEQAQEAEKKAEEKKARQAQEAERVFLAQLRTTFGKHMKVP